MPARQPAARVMRVSRGLRLDHVAAFVRSSAQAGVHVIQLREPELNARELAALARALVMDAAVSDMSVVVNERTDVALIAGAAGVHLKASGPPVDAVRAIVPAGFLIGRSAHDDTEIDLAAGADYLVFGTIFDTPSKPDLKGQGLAALTRAVARFAGPVFGIGGLGPAHAADVHATGAAGYAAISGFGPTL